MASFQEGFMTRITPVALGLLLAGFVSFESSQVSAQSGGWTDLFDGKTLKGWNTVGTANWQVVDGAVQATSGNGDIVSVTSYGDFQLVVEFWADDDANSGVFFRCSDLKTFNAKTAYEAQIFDKRPDPEFRTGALTFISKPAATINVGGKWNTFDITAQGTHLILTLNGTRMVDVQNAQFARGPIALQRTGGVIKFRSVRIRTL
jgi:hypothetical protein